MYINKNKSYLKGNDLMGNFNFIETNIEGLYVIESKLYIDARGYFQELYKKMIFIKLDLICSLFKRMNLSPKRST